MPKLTLRDLFAIVTIVAVAIAFWTGNKKWYRWGRDYPAWKLCLSRVAILLAALVVALAGRMFFGLHPFGAAILGIAVIALLSPGIPFIRRSPDNREFRD